MLSAQAYPRPRADTKSQAHSVSGPASRMGSGQLGDTALVKAKRHQRACKSPGKGLMTAQPEEIWGAQSTCARSDHHPDLTPSSAQWPLSNISTAGPGALTTGQKPLLPRLGGAVGKNCVWGEGDQSVGSWHPSAPRAGLASGTGWLPGGSCPCSVGPGLQPPQLYSRAEKSQALRFTSKR